MKKLALLLVTIAATLILTACSYSYNFKIDEEGNITGGNVVTVTADDIREIMIAEAIDADFFDWYFTDFDALAHESDEYLVDAMMRIYSKGEGWYQERTRVNGQLAVAEIGEYDDVEMRETRELLNRGGAYIWDSTKFIYTAPTYEARLEAQVPGPFSGYKALVVTEINSLSKAIGRELRKYEKAAVDKLLHQNFVVTLPSKVVYTNGELSDDGKTVTWSADKFTNDDKLFAYTADAEEVAGMVFEDTTDTEEAVEEVVTLTNVKKNNVTYKKSAKVTTTSPIKAIYVNGKKIKSKSKVKFTKDGKYTIKVVTEAYTKTVVVTKKTKKSN